jgi:hypothetical protein
MTQTDKLKPKIYGPITSHLGMDFFRDDDNTLCLSFVKYIEKLTMNCEQIFGQQPKQNASSPLENRDHPETDSSNLLDAKSTQMYQSIIGALQWMVTIGLFEITTAVMIMSGIRVAPCTGHLERVKQIYGYLSKMRHLSIRVCINEPYYSDLPEMEHDWSRSVYAQISHYQQNIHHRHIAHDKYSPIGLVLQETSYG